MKIAIITILIFCSTSVLLYSQALDEAYESLLLEEDDNTTGLAFKPVIGFGVGSLTFYGEVADYYRKPLSGQTSGRISISRNIGNYLDIEFHGTFGNVGGNQYNGDFDKTLNFETSVFLGGVSLAYNFNHILKRKRPIHPYISIGAEILQFSAKGDLYNQNDVKYNYWTDGTIRDVEQAVGAAGELISRDFSYETDLRSENLYGYGDYSQTSLAIPIDAGVNITVTDRVTCRLGFAFHLTATDYVDNMVGGSNDNILNTYVALTFDMFSEADDIAAVENFKNLKYTITDNQDSDQDGVDDFNDECPGTPAGVKVTHKGCAEDTDKDGVPDYLDKQMDTPSGTFAVGANGIKIMDGHLIAMLYDPDAVKRSEIKLYSKTTEANGASSSDGIPDKFKVVDVNEDNYISHDELQKAIDAIFEMNSTLTPGDIYELQEFFFNQ